MITKKQLFCGFFDSKKYIKNKIKTDIRIVLDYEIELFDTDGGISFIDDRSYPVKRGMLLFVKPGQKRHSSLPVRCRYIRIHPDANIPKELTELLGSFPECVYLESKQEIKSLLRQFEQLGELWLHNTQSHDPLMLNALFYSLLCQYKKLAVGSGSGKAPPAHSKIVSDVQAYLNVHFSENCSLRSPKIAV